MASKQKIEPDTSRLEARISTDLHALLKRAAAVQGRTVTDFVTTAVERAARDALEDAEILRLSTADQVRFVDAILKPPAPAPALRRARQRHQTLIEST